MTFTVTLDLSAEAEAELRDGIAAGDTERVRRILANALTPTVEALLRSSSSPDPKSSSADREDGVWERVADRLVDTFAELVSADTPDLSDHAVSRAGIYQDHP